jgi:hypothetical protein
MELFNQQYNLYSHSYLCYGIEQIRRVYIGQLIKKANNSLVIDDPCLQAGFIQNRTYEDIFDTPCANGSYIPPAHVKSSSIFSLR